ETTMGLTPAGGLVMSTRSGDLDPGVLLYLLQEKGVDPATVNKMVNRQGGLLGVSGISPDMKELVNRASEDPQAAEAVDLFCYQAKKFLGALAAVLGGLDTLVFTGGIGENAPSIRERICEGMEFLGIGLDLGRNETNAPIISRDGRPAMVRVMKTNEERIIARETNQLLREREEKTMDQVKRQVKAKELRATSISRERLDQLDAYWRAANYLGAAQLYLQDNPLLRRPLRAEEIKPRLLGHWGTQPGINLIYTHLNRLIQDTDAEILLVVGPGHGAPAILANLYLEGTLGEYDSALRPGLEGAHRLVRQFSWPYGAPSHLVPQTPGMIQEGGELGYSLAHAYGAAFDNPDLIVTCIVGDGEAETGPLAAAWHSNKFLDPVSSGAVLPILHLNGYKLSGPTLLGRMDDGELEHLFTGYGHRARFVSGDNPREVHPAMWEALDWAYREIRDLQARARNGQIPERPAWPMILLRTPKGWTGPKSLDGHPIEGTFHAHQIPIVDPVQNPAHLKAVEDWLRGYRPEELFDEAGKPLPEVAAVCPRGDRRIGMNRHANGGQRLAPLKLPDFTRYAVEVPAPGAVDAQGTRDLARSLRDTFRANEAEKNFRVFCPDETTSNRMDPLFEATGRAWIWPKVNTDEFLAGDGRVMEILSEHTCQGWLEGYLLTGRHGLFACYEAFTPIVDSMLNQHAKWLKVARETPWRKPIASLNYLLTSHVWRQDHNGYSHQVPSFINNVVNKKSSVARIYFPPDANCLLSVMDHCLRSREYVNLVVASKQSNPQWLGMKEAEAHCARGASVWEWAGNDAGRPDVVLAAAGDVPTTETVAAAWLLQRALPGIRVRVANVVDLFSLMSHRDHSHGLDEAAFNKIFTEEADVIFAFHGYPRLIHELIYHRPHPSRFHVHGYMEEGRTTTPFDMLVLNQMSRYDLAIAALKRVERLRSQAGEAVDLFERRLAAHQAYIRERDEDLPEVVNWRWSASEREESRAA
ncbi:MAG: phosphoketolase, partial [Candidatus Manganitrophaceae bacterium]